VADRGGARANPAIIIARAELILEAKVAGVPVLACNYGVSNGKYALKVDQLLAGCTSSWIGEKHA